MNKKIVISEKSIVDFISHDGCGKKLYNIKTDIHRDAREASTIFKEEIKFDYGKNPSAKDLNDTLRVWFKIIL